MIQAIIQLRGEVSIAQDIRNTLTMLNIHRMSHATFVLETDAYRGMVSKVNDFAAHDEPGADVVETLISTRAGSEESGGDTTDEQASENTGCNDAVALTQAIVDEETALREQGVPPVIRLHPLRNGHHGQKHATKKGDQLGRHSTEQIDELPENIR